MPDVMLSRRDGEASQVTQLEILRFAQDDDVARRRLHLIFVVLLLLASCAGNINPSRQLDDAALATSVREALRNDPVLRPFNISVAARRGEVTLTGVVHTAAQRDRATAVAQAAGNVRSVSNLLALQ